MACVRPCRLFRAAAPMAPAAGEALRWRRRCCRACRGAVRCRPRGRSLFGWFCVRLSGVYLAMLTLAFAADRSGRWPSSGSGRHGRRQRDSRRLARRLGRPTAGSSTISSSPLVLGGVLLLRRVIVSPFGWRCGPGATAPLRAEAIGIDVRADAVAGLRVSPGPSPAWPAGSTPMPRAACSPTWLGDPALGRRAGDGAARRRADAVRARSWVRGPPTRLETELVRLTELLAAAARPIIIVLVLLFPQGIAGRFASARGRGLA